ncbi:hypothetical protein F0562_034765 [Nyssa sinensis]|uniref:DUF679 domain-containing protein n=1 Tax=Nyssa sinensis TaxID=561372 RepID=A0A5J5AAG5_9ASTE|nr:hypothetical protein F0562_034765 [Nyssa sinensis]
MGTEVLRPRDCLIERIRIAPAVFNRRKTCYGNGNPRFRKPVVRPDFRPDQKKASISKRPSSSEGLKKNQNGNLVMGQVTILRRGESLDSKMKGDQPLKKNGGRFNRVWNPAVGSRTGNGPEADQDRGPEICCVSYRRPLPARRVRRIGVLGLSIPKLSSSTFILQQETRLERHRRLSNQRSEALASTRMKEWNQVDSYTDDDGKTHYGIATMKGLWPSKDSRSKDLSSYKLRFGDFVHAFFSLVVFAVVSLLDSNTVQCFYPSFESSEKVLLMVLPPVIGAVSSSVFVMFPNKRHGIGYPSSQSSKDS